MQMGVLTKKHSAASFSFAFYKLPKTMALNQPFLIKIAPVKKLALARWSQLQGGLNCKVVPCGNLLCLGYDQSKVTPQPHPANLSELSLILYSSCHTLYFNI